MKNSTDKLTLKRFWEAGLPYKKLLVVAILFPIGSILLNTALPMVVSKMLASLASGHGHASSFMPYFLGIAILGLACNRFGFAAMLRHQAKTMEVLQNDAYETLLKRSLSFHNNNIGGKLVSDAIDYPASYSQMYGAVFATLLPFSVTLISGIMVVSMNSLLLGLILFAMSAYAILSGYFESKTRKPLRTKRLNKSKEITGHIADSIINIQTVKTFAHEHQEINRLQDLYRKLTKYRINDWSDAAFRGNNRIAIIVFLQFILLSAAFYVTRQNPALLASSIFAFSFTIVLGNKLFEINTLQRTIEDALLQASPMTEILNQDVTITDEPSAKQLVVTKGHIKLASVDFHYQDTTQDNKVFADINLDIKPGKRIGLVGRSGGGKSTLTRLLLRFEDITAGAITIDEQNIRAVTQRSLRQSISYVPQEPLLFHRSLLENIRYGKQTASVDEIIKAAKLAHADEFIQKLPAGYQTLVGERGVKLSGGQRQRVAIARAMLKDAPILILDEATSALDSESEKLIQDALWKLMEGRTAIVIAHRLSTIQKMDRIIVLEEGKIAEEGSHKELLAKKGVYAGLWAHQSGGFIEE